MMRDTILCLCDLTGVMARPWVEDGYHAILVDPQHGPGATYADRVTRIGRIIDDPMTWGVIRMNADRIAFMAAFPPCTDLAVSGARWFEHKRAIDPAVQFKAMQVVWQCHVIAEMLGVPYFIENPVSQISSYWRKPDHWFHPWHYAGLAPNDNYTKKTCLWSGGGFVMPPKCLLDGAGQPDDRIHKCPPSAERGNIRSATPEGFARAVYLSNAPMELTAGRHANVA